MTTMNPKPPPATSPGGSKDWGKLLKLHGRIKPPEGWRPVATEGFLIAEEAVDLVRLRDVVDWLALGMPRDAVLRRCLGKLVDTDDLYPLCMFYVLDPDGEPVRVLDRFQASMAAATALGLPGVYPTSEPVEVAAWLLEAWWRVWPGHSDISHTVDRVETIQGRRDKGRRFRLQKLGLTESDVEDDPPAYWPADDVLLASLDRLALPVFVAFDLWGYGVDMAASAVGVDTAAATSTSNVSPLTQVDVPQDATNDQWWLTWCSERIAANTKPDGSRKEGKARAPWTDDDVRVFDLRLSTLIGRGQADSAAKNAIASDLKTSVQALRLPLEKRDALQVNANNQQSRKVN